MTAPLVFLDTETDGVHPARQPWEIALIRREPDGSEREIVMMLPIDLATSDPFGLAIGRFYDRHPTGIRHRADWTPSVRSGRLTPLDDAARTVARMTHGAHVVGAVPNFDTEILDRLLRQHGLAPTHHYHLVDVENLAVGYLAGRGKPLPPPWSSDALNTALGLPDTPPEDRHTALGDARWAKRVYDRVMGAA